MENFKDQQIITLVITHCEEKCGKARKQILDEFAHHNFTRDIAAFMKKRWWYQGPVQQKSQKDIVQLLKLICNSEDVRSWLLLLFSSCCSYACCYCLYKWWKNKQYQCKYNIRDARDNFQTDKTPQVYENTSHSQADVCTENITCMANTGTFLLKWNSTLGVRPLFLLS